MADQQNRIPWNLLLTILIVGLAGWILWDVFDVGTKITIHQSVNDIVNGRDPIDARKELLTLNARAETIEALADALNADNDQVTGKIEIISTLNAFKETRPVVRALNADVASTRYAAAVALHGRKPHKERVGEIAMEWLGDSSAPARYQAILIARALNLEAALPKIIEALDEVVAGDASVEMARAVMESLKKFQPDGVAEKVVKVAGDPNLDFRYRIEALKVLPQLKAASKEEMLPLVLGIVKDKKANKVLRMNAAMVLRDKDLYNEETDAVLRAVLVDPAGESVEVQRECLKRLGLHAPLPELKELLQSRPLRHHKYFGIRSDVATALAGMNLEDRVTFDILCEYLVDVDGVGDKNRDRAFIVRREAWCSLWLLTGMMAGLKERDLFKTPYKLPEEVDRSVLFRFNYNRPGITPAMVTAMDRLTPDLNEMQKIRTEYANAWETIQKLREERAKAKKEREEAAKKAKDEAAKKKEDEPAPGG
jgi:hypothetical protein